jgi:ABC-type polysaccharide/polyol phosphate transport system ATPase subunit
VGEPAVVFDRVWKKYNRGERFNSLRDLIPEMASALLRRRRRAELQAQEFWALRDVSFEVKPGGALGIIGPNGAGKSTVLKVLTKVLRADRGRAEVRGRLGALVEIAAGFHPDLTGRENVFMQGAIMGMRRAEILARFDEIVGFAGVEEFIDTPIKRYSSGMNARLGFAVAAHLDPEVLLIDEVLSVGDLSFQERCLERMQRFVRSGVPMVFVSHNLSAVSVLCDRVMVLDAGRVRTMGPTQEAIAAYASVVQEARTSEPDRRQITVALQAADGLAVSEIQAGGPLTVRVRAHAGSDLGRLQVSLVIQHLESGSLIYRAESEHVGAPPLDPGPVGGIEAIWSLSANLGRGHYAVSAVLLSQRRGWVAQSAPALLSVVERESVRATVFLDATCELRPLASDCQGVPT